MPRLTLLGCWWAESYGQVQQVQVRTPQADHLHHHYQRQQLQLQLQVELVLLQVSQVGSALTC